SPFRQRPLTVGNSSNALVNFSIIERLLEERQLVLLLDYDGTLTPIVRDPAAALLPADVRATLTELAKHFVVGVVSGRSLEKIRDFVKVDTLFYAGSHGFDIHAPAQRDGGDGVRYQVASEFLPVLQEVREESEEAVKEISGASVEDNLFSISLHYRNCARADVPRVAAIAREVQGRHAGIRLRSGKEVFELQPDIEWNKGSAVVWLLGMLGLGAGPDAANGASAAAARPKVFTIFIGDDKTDEDAFCIF
ncbi:unnamed protein product, partial [Phaeothamnion confervicola]